MTYLIVIAFVVGIALIGGVGAWLVTRAVRHRALLRALSYQLLLVRVPKTHPSEQGTPDNITAISATEQFVASLATFKTPISLEVAVPHIGEEIHFYIGAPRSISEAVTRQAQSVWPDANITAETSDYNVFTPHGATSGAYVVAKERHGMPIRTYAEVKADTFASILGGFTKINALGEGAAVQLILYPAVAAEKKRLIKLLDGLRSGKSVKELTATSVLPTSVNQVADVLFDNTISQTNTQQQQPAPAVRVDEELARALESKVAKPLLWTMVRVVAAGTTQREADAILDGIAAGFSQFTAPRRNELKLIKPRNISKFAYGFSFREFDYAQASLLNTEEIASLYHFPTPHTDAPKIKWLGAKEAAAPPNLPTSGLLLGDATYRGERTPVYLTEEDRRRHIYVVGQTGTGKSTLLGNLILDDIKNGKGVAIIDPHGELAETALAQVPPERIDDVVYFNPGDLMRPIGLNMLDFNHDHPEEKTFIVNEMQSIFNKLFPPETMGPMFEQYMRNALLLLMEDAQNEPATLIEVPRIFTDVEFRRRKLARISNPIVIDFWTKEAEKAGGDAALANMTPYITSKFSNFIANDYMRPIIGQTQSAFNFRQVMDEGKILLVNLSKGRIGDINANLLGMIIVGKLLMAALSRTDTDVRRDFHLYIDEFQNFTTDSIATILSEARKYRLTLTVAHQFIAQLTDKIRDAIFGNVGNQLVMRVGVQDAEVLAKQFEPVIGRNDLANVENLHAYARIMINGQVTQPFGIEVGHQSWEKGKPEYVAQLREYARLKYGADRATVEASITQRLRG